MAMMTGPGNKIQRIGTGKKIQRIGAGKKMQRIGAGKKIQRIGAGKKMQVSQRTLIVLLERDGVIQSSELLRK